MSPAERDALERLARRVRERIVRLATGGGCFLGASLSCADLLVALYSRFLRVSPSTLDAPDRDVFLLSKGHDVPALYALFAELGILPAERLGNHLKTHDHVYWHPNARIPGVEFHSGSLGHLLSVGLGIALDMRLRQLPSRVVVLVGDGELDEGSMWEALLVAHAQRLTNVLMVVDRNGFQANGRTEEISPLEPLGAKLAAFGCGVARVDGHDLDALDGALDRFPWAERGPSVLIADTVRGKGLPSLESRADRWFCDFSAGEVEMLVEELHGTSEALLTTPGRTVR